MLFVVDVLEMCQLIPKIGIEAIFYVIACRHDLTHNDNFHHILTSLKLTSTMGCIDLHNPHHSAAN